MIHLVLAAVVLLRLGQAPLVGNIPSIDSLANRLVATEAQRWADAEQAVGLTQAQAVELNLALLRSKVRYGVLPRHLDAMAYYSRGVKVLRNVTIPAHTKGWEIDLNGLSVYVPQACGNLSIVRRVVLLSPPTALPHTSAAVAIPSPSPVPTNSPTVAPTGPVFDQTKFAIETPPAQTHHNRFPWWLAFLLLPLAFHDNHGNSSFVAQPTPTPLVTCAP